MTTLTKQEIEAKGISLGDVLRLLKSSESRINVYCKTFLQNGNKCSEDFQKSWDAECARWDHFKAIIEVMVK